MAVAACGICCDVCGRCLKLGFPTTCAPGTDETAPKKLDAQRQFFQGHHCPILACAVENKVGHCLKDCEEFPCTRFESGFESLLGPGPFPYSTSFLNVFKTRLGEK